MPVTPLPPTLAQEWAKLKAKLVPTIDKLSGTGMTPQFKKELKTKVEKLFKEFDMGLKAKLEEASKKGGDEAKTKQAVSNVFSVSQDYLKKIQTAKQQWGVDGKSIAELIEERLKKINAAAKKSLG